MAAATKNADGHTFKELYDAATSDQTEVKAMTNFNDWYTRTPKNFPASLNNLSSLLRQAYEAGAASESETLRDKFAGQALIYIMGDNRVETYDFGSVESYKMADAMLKARRV